MDRCSSDQIKEDFNLVAARSGDLAGTALAEIGEIELDDQKMVRAKDVGQSGPRIDQERPDIPNELIRLTAADLLLSRTEQLDQASIEALLAEMENSGLIEQTAAAVDPDTGQPVVDQPGWRPSRAGVQLFGAFMTADRDQATLGD